MAKINLGNGVTIEGTIEEIMALHKAAGEAVDASENVVADEGYAQPTSSCDGYKLVTDRKAKLGDFVKFTELAGKGCADYITVGDKYYEIIGIDAEGDPKVYDNDGDIYDTYGDKFDVYEKVELAEKHSETLALKVGDYVRVTHNRRHGEMSVHAFEINEIVRVLDTVESLIHKDRIRAERIGGSDFWYVHVDDFVRATDEEIAQASEQRRWAKIGRKPNEFKVGDIVRVIKTGTHHFKIDELTEIVAIDGVGPNKIRGYGSACPYLFEHEIELVATAEGRVDR